MEQEFGATLIQQIQCTLFQMTENQTKAAMIISLTALLRYLAFLEGLNSGSRRPFVYTHFRPRWILIKNYTLATDWEIYDAVRSPTNIMKHRLYANLTDAEYSDDNQISFFSNGFRIDSTTTGLNANSSNYLYAAFAENPFSANGGLAR